MKIMLKLKKFDNEKTETELGTAHLCNLTQEAEIGSITVWGQHKQKTPIVANKKLGTVGCTCHPNYVGSINRIAV